MKIRSLEKHTKDAKGTITKTETPVVMDQESLVAFVEGVGMRALDPGVSIRKMRTNRIGDRIVLSVDLDDGKTLHFMADADGKPEEELPTVIEAIAKADTTPLPVKEIPVEEKGK